VTAPDGNGVTFGDLPASATWRHHDGREGFESVGLHTEPSGYRLDGHTAGVEKSQVWAARYAITLDERWATRTARIWGRSAAGPRDTRLDADGLGHWTVDGTPMSELEGCLDVDIESSACTNTFPVHRLKLAVGQSAEAPAAYVRAIDLQVERLDQSYTRLDDVLDQQRYEYRAPRFGFRARLVFDESGLLLDYPGIATRTK